MILMIFFLPTSTNRTVLQNNLIIQEKKKIKMAARSHCFYINVSCIDCGPKCMPYITAISSVRETHTHPLINMGIH